MWKTVRMGFLNKSYMYMFEDSTMKPIKNCSEKEEGGKKEWKYNGGGELVKSIPYICKELPQLKTLISLIYTNLKDGKTIFKKASW
jgi:hypothetical protein